MSGGDATAGRGLPIVFVQLGSRTPGFLATSAAQARAVTGEPTVVVGPRAGAAYRSPGLDRFRASERLSELGLRGFWRHACERFFVLEEHMRRAGLERCFHLESDVLLYLAPGDFDGWLRRVYGGSVAVCPLTDGEDTAAAMYVGSLAALAAFNDALLELVALGPEGLLAAHGGPMANEMRMLHILRRDGLAGALPTTISEGEAVGAPCLFDPASYGQWAGGTHSRPGSPYAGDHHAIGRELLAGRCDLAWDPRRHAPSVVAAHGGGAWPLATFHVHSKRLADWAWTDLAVARRTRLRRRSPFGDEVVTGERLQGLAELSFVPAETESLHRGLARFAPERVVVDDWAQVAPAEIARASARRVLFVYTHALDGFVEHVWPRLEGEGYVLVTHNSDAAVDARHAGWIDAQGAKLRCWFAQNAVVAHPRLVPLPVGIANSMWAHGNLRALERAAAAGEPARELLHARFDPGTHSERSLAFEALARAFPGVHADANRRLRFPAYLAELARHRFCVCPRGNGPDTHRFWECQYLDVVPVVRRSPDVEHWQLAGLPVVILDDWSELTRERLEAEQPAVSARRRELLALSHYRGLVQAASSR
jgi:hypothetical protein